MKPTMAEFQMPVMGFTPITVEYEMEVGMVASATTRPAITSLNNSSGRPVGDLQVGKVSVGVVSGVGDPMVEVGVGAEIAPSDAPSDDASIWGVRQLLLEIFILDILMPETLWGL